ERKSFVHDALLDEFSKVFLIPAEAPRHKSSARSKRQQNGIHGRFDVSKRHAFGLHANSARRRSLSRRETVNLVVHHDVQQVHVAAHRMDEMIASNAEAVAVSPGYQD